MEDEGERRSKEHPRLFSRSKNPSLGRISQNLNWSAQNILSLTLHVFWCLAFSPLIDRVNSQSSLKDEIPAAAINSQPSKSIKKKEYKTAT